MSGVKGNKSLSKQSSKGNSQNKSSKDENEVHDKTEAPPFIGNDKTQTPDPSPFISDARVIEDPQFDQQVNSPFQQSEGQEEYAEELGESYQIEEQPAEIKGNLLGSATLVEDAAFMLGNILGGVDDGFVEQISQDEDGQMEDIEQDKEEEEQIEQFNQEEYIDANQYLIDDNQDLNRQIEEVYSQEIINPKVTKDTRGANLAQIFEQNQNEYAKTEKLDQINQFEGIFQADNFDQYTNFDKKIMPMNEFDTANGELIGFMDDDESIQPKSTYEISQTQVEMVQQSWSQVRDMGMTTVGVSLMKNLFRINPQLLQLFSFKNAEDLYQSEELKIQAKKVLVSLNKTIKAIDQPQQLGQALKSLGKIHQKLGVKKEHFNIMGKAILITIESILKEQFSQELRQAWVIFLMRVSIMMISDNYEQQELIPIQQQVDAPGQGDESCTSARIKKSVTGKSIFTHHENSDRREKETERKSTQSFQSLTDNQLVLVQTTWGQFYRKKELHPLVFKNFFNLYPETMTLFSFRGVQDVVNSQQLRDHSDKVVQFLNSVISQLSNIEKMNPQLEDLGLKHFNKFLTKSYHFNGFGAALIKTIKDSQNFSDDAKSAWEAAFSLIQKIMTSKDQKQILDNFTELDGIEIGREKTLDYEQLLITMRHDDSMRLLVDKSNLYDAFSEQAIKRKKQKVPEEAQQLDRESRISIAQEPLEAMDQKTVHDYYLKMFRKEVDFHHKIAYRFEKAYRLGKQTAPDKRHHLNLEIIDCISEHASYIEQDPMALFYCLFFCIYYKNQELVEFIRALILKIHTHERIDRLLEYIDIHGINRIRTKGEQINQFVYHMVFYQAMDDDLRIVYSQIMRQLRFIQLRDKDALHLLYQRDYELIRLTFDKYSVKINMLQFYKEIQPMKAHTYRKYNQAYYEELVIDYKVEQRVAQNYRERFLMTKEDIYIVFEMYCKEDYEEQFILTEKDEITHKQFVELFLICLRNDSFKIAILLYANYLSESDIDSKMMDVLLQSIKDSTKSHEMKLFFIHQHFDILSVSQMNQLLDVYDEVLHSKDPLYNPMLSQYNVVKIALLIFRICWRIEEKQIFSLITKCSVLQTFINKSLKSYFDKQNNILVLLNYMAEPILHMTERKDSFDIMYEMDMKELLLHPVIVEVLNLIYEGKFSISSSAISMSTTFMCLLNMETTGNKRINDKLLENIQNLGDIGSTRQTSLQYNIWKQCIQQREQDEMFFTVLFNILILFISSAIIIVRNESQTLMSSRFTHTYGDQLSIFLNADQSVLVSYCEEEINLLLKENSLLVMYSAILLFNSFGMLTSVVQKILTFKFRDNVTLPMAQIMLEMSIACVGLAYIISVSSTNYNTVLTDNCSKFVEIPPDEIPTINKIYTLRHPLSGQLNLTFIISTTVVQCGFISVLMMKRTQKLGELIVMLQEMVTEMIKFFATFGLIIGIFLIVGILLLHDLKQEKYYIFIDLFDAMNGNQEFKNFTKPLGQVYIAIFTYLFRVLFISLLTAMFINKYKLIWTNLDAFKLFNIVRQKNSLAFDKYIGGITMTFFPINILILPLSVPVLSLRNARVSDFALKTQYLFMMILYIFLILIVIVPSIPILYLKICINAIYNSFSNNREDYRGQNIFTLFVSLFFGPLICIVSVIIDLVSVPGMLLRGSVDFEHKYILRDTLSEKQTQIVLGVFGNIFTGTKAHQYRGKSLTLGQLMDIHGKYYLLIDNMHDLMCRGSKDYREALKNVQDYNMSKILSAKCAIPDKNGDFKMGKCEIEILFNVFLDVKLYNFIDVILRKYFMGILEEELRKKSKSRSQGSHEDLVDVEVVNQQEIQRQQNEENENDEDDDNKRVGGIEPRKMGPDGVLLYRNPTDLLNNFFINITALSFTDIQNNLEGGGVNSQEIKRLKRYEKEIDTRKDNWKENTIGTFVSQTDRYKSQIKRQLENLKVQAQRIKRGEIPTDNDFIKLESIKSKGKPEPEQPVTEPAKPEKQRTRKKRMQSQE